MIKFCTHTTGHAEATKIEFNPDKVSYEILLKHFFRMHDPTQLNRQGPDIGDSYRSAIFYTDAVQSEQAEAAKHAAQRNFDNPIVTEIVKSGAFYDAEEYHQHYAQKTGVGACHVSYVALA